MDESQEKRQTRLIILGIRHWTLLVIVKDQSSQPCHMKLCAVICLIAGPQNLIIKYVTSEGAVSQQLSIACYQVSFLLITILSIYQ